MIIGHWTLVLILGTIQLRLIGFLENDNKVMFVIEDWNVALESKAWIGWVLGNKRKPIYLCLPISEPVKTSIIW